MEQPEGFRNGNLVLKLNKALYGLKQASRMWNEKFNNFMLKIGFKRCASDRCLYVKNDNDILIYVLLYVDDLLIISKDMRKITIIKQLLAKEFEMTDIGNASTFLGMHIEQDKKNSTISMSQGHESGTIRVWRGANRRLHQLKRVYIWNLVM